MGACGCKTSNVVQPSSVKSNGNSQKSRTPFVFGKDLILTEVDSVSKLSLDANNNKNVSKEQDVISNRVAQNDRKILNKYNFQTAIGEGSFSKVFRVQNKQTAENYALKIVDKAKSLESGMPCYKQELAILKRARHRNIISLHEVYYSSAKVYLLMELATGGNLFDRLSSNGSYSEPLAQYTLRMTTSGLAYLHHLGVTHRDLKLENLLYRSTKLDSDLLISDFGLSHMTEGDRTSNLMCTTCGSEEYLAPEVLEGLEYTSTIDTWALGVITYAILCSHMPFVDQSRARLHQRIKSGIVSFREPSWLELSPLAKEFICKLLEVNPDERLSASEALDHPWLSSSL